MKIKFTLTIQLAIGAVNTLITGKIPGAAIPRWDNFEEVFFDEIKASPIIKVDWDESDKAYERVVDFYFNLRKVASVRLFGIQLKNMDCAIWAAESISYLPRASERWGYDEQVAFNSENDYNALQRVTITLSTRADRLMKLREQTNKLLAPPAA